MSIRGGRFYSKLPENRRKCENYEILKSFRAKTNQVWTRIKNYPSGVYIPEFFIFYFFPLSSFATCLCVSSFYLPHVIQLLSHFWHFHILVMLKYWYLLSYLKQIYLVLIYKNDLFYYKGLNLRVFNSSRASF